MSTAALGTETFFSTRSLIPCDRRKKEEEEEGRKGGRNMGGVIVGITLLLPLLCGSVLWRCMVHTRGARTGVQYEFQPYHLTTGNYFMYITQCNVMCAVQVYCGDVHLCYVYKCKHAAMRTCISMFMCTGVFSNVSPPPIHTFLRQCDDFHVLGFRVVVFIVLVFFLFVFISFTCPYVREPWYARK